ncbi:ATP synthase F1 subunit gamma [Clostridium lundense]|uniref:ATP synthase F1 subunit gamma n=1 Tax=Clostridium lundense TaxID=319475 RepID=UPI00048732C5|nr:ATP synthase F1 subunit gamma [Clostridium lundense]
MAAVGLIEIRRRMKSVTNTQKITKAMGIVATSKLKKVRVKLEGNKAYNDHFEDVKNHIVNSLEGNNLYTKKTGEGKTLYLVITSNLGLCGGYNINVVNEAIKALTDNKENSILMVVGRKGKSYFNKFRIPIEKEFLNIDDDPKLENIKDISNLILNLYKDKTINSVYIVYTRFVSTVKQEVETKKILPLQISDNVDLKYNFEFEISPNMMLEQMVEPYINQKILNYLLNSKVSEQAARMTAMDGASKNAKDILDKLNTQYNRIRQSAITEEISEIIGGAEAQK